ncbi:hypothetical protein BpHYR1_046134 [Brachionus plicatilis]|uniref:Uncharacterized protein n=1 Tax=Brachionus plicatilis TaxID=10195 RepID=A0A3M7PNK0_BRAPC|nr:hypothetical protein BpHYR1_046134 [Brachionus plicatilis]
MLNSNKILIIQFLGINYVNNAPNCQFLSIISLLSFIVFSKKNLSHSFNMRDQLIWILPVM